VSDAPTEYASYDEERGWREAEQRRVRRTRRTLVIVLAVLVLLLLIASYALVAIFRPAGKVASQSEAGGVKWVRSIYGWGPAADQRFWGPQGASIGSDGTIWVTTQGQGRVVGFNPDGTPSSMLFHAPSLNPAVPSEAFTFAAACAADPSGLVYIADTPRNTVWVTTPDNHVVNSMFVPNPVSVAVTKDRLVVGSASGFVIMTPAGRVLKVIGKKGKGVDQFESVMGLAIGKDGTIYAADQYNNRLSAYDRDGKRKWIIGTGNPGNQKSVASSIVARGSRAPAAMQIPAGMTIDGAGRLVIADPFGFDLTVLNPKDGALIAKYGAPGTLDGQFVYPSSVSYDPKHDWFAVADTQNARVQIVRLPNSGGSALATARRTLSGPLRACCFPLLLIILVILFGLIWRAIQRRREQNSDADQQEMLLAEADAEGAETS
jgi:DNA-binding beta-propeller fold protein YncE